ncbi:transposase [Nostoc sp. 'Peltigera membranacea cyanobiont' N6]|nr:transposase [Nostoc sp. 'Peltigera membranacea cyanobiont' N6]
MNTQKIFYLNKLRCEVAMQQALQDWQPQPKTYGFECPRCNSTRLVKIRSSNSIQKYLCNDCDRSFQERPRFVCECLIPGHQLNCQSCPQFKEFLGLVKQKMDELRFLSFQELQSLKSSYTVAETLD